MNSSLRKMHFDGRLSLSKTPDKFFCYFVKFPGSKFKFLVGKSESDNTAKSPSSLSECVRDGNFYMYCPEMNAGIFNQFALKFCQQRSFTIEWLTEAELKRIGAAQLAESDCPQCREMAELMPKLKDCVEAFAKMQKAGGSSAPTPPTAVMEPERRKSMK